MARALRLDAPGVLFHLFNRGTMKRPIFVGQGSFRAFKALVARQVKRGRFRLHCMCLMDTHFHLIVTSGGELSAALQVIESQYARAFNQHHSRYGHLFGGRFGAVPILDAAQLLNAFSYVDMNPVDAGICDSPMEYEHSTARVLATGFGVPRWLDRSLVDEILVDPWNSKEREREYARVFHERRTAGSQAVAKSRMSHASQQRDSLSLLLWGTEQRRLQWFIERATSEDGHARQAPFVDTPSVLACVTSEERRDPSAQATIAGALRHLVGLTLASIASVLECGVSTAHRRVQEHCARMATCSAYQAAFVEFAARCLRVCFGASLDPVYAQRIVAADLLGPAEEHAKLAAFGVSGAGRK